MNISSSTTVHRDLQARPGAPSPAAPYLVGREVREMTLDGKVEPEVAERWTRQTEDFRADGCTLLTDASALKALFTTEATTVAAAKAECDAHCWTEVDLDLGNGKRTYHVERDKDLGYLMHDADMLESIQPQAVILEKNGKYAHLSTYSPGDVDYVQDIRMSFTKSGNFVPDSETMHIGPADRRQLGAHIGRNW